MVSVTTHYAVIQGLGVKSKPIKADQALQSWARKKVESLMKKGLIAPPKTEFAGKLLEDPLFSHWLDVSIHCAGDTFASALSMRFASADTDTWI